MSRKARAHKGSHLVHPKQFEAQKDFAGAVPDPPFRNPDCGGQQIHNATIFCGCVPQSNDALLDFQDFVNFLAGKRSYHGFI